MPSSVASAGTRPEAWRAAVEDSAFDCTATYNGGRDDRSVVPPGSTGTMLWHELMRRG